MENNHSCHYPTLNSCAATYSRERKVRQIRSLADGLRGNHREETRCDELHGREERTRWEEGGGDGARRCGMKERGGEMSGASGRQKASPALLLPCILRRVHHRRPGRLARRRRLRRPTRVAQREQREQREQGEEGEHGEHGEQGEEGGSGNSLITPPHVSSSCFLLVSRQSSLIFNNCQLDFLLRHYARRRCQH